MSVSVVNGYVCYSSCDQAKARSGKDPHPKQDSTENVRNNAGAADGPAVTFGGALADLKAVRPTDAGSSADGPTRYPQRASIDILA